MARMMTKTTRTMVSGNHVVPILISFRYTHAESSDEDDVDSDDEDFDDTQCPPGLEPSLFSRVRSLPCSCGA